MHLVEYFLGNFPYTKLIMQCSHVLEIGLYNQVKSALDTVRLPGVTNENQEEELQSNSDGEINQEENEEDINGTDSTNLTVTLVLTQ